MTAIIVLGISNLLLVIAWLAERTKNLELQDKLNSERLANNPDDYLSPKSIFESLANGTTGQPSRDLKIFRPE